eukprot:TRINITY_DN84_c2_g1_i1.p1 TRINITY_DN84_c2_g1~~TRINITY_DN84_c2_g1_i1.p1  ORF type:complete len:125 (-),score=34.37 TRINITY_DN84_c2_g1_i1:244-618(-)
MPFICYDVVGCYGKVYGEQGFTPGQCVAFVKQCSGAPQTSRWRKGVQVKYNNIVSGTAIASFSGFNGTYSGSKGHAAIFIRKRPEGIVVYDQWVGHPVSERTIFYKGDGNYSNDADLFFVIEVI